MIGKFLERVKSSEQGGATRDDDHRENHGSEDNGRKNDEGGRLKVEFIHEQDMQGRTRPWQEIRPDETLEERKKWVVVIVLTWRE